VETNKQRFIRKQTSILPLERGGGGGDDELQEGSYSAITTATSTGFTQSKQAKKKKAITM
jgi:hypothetical protein